MDFVQITEVIMLVLFGSAWPFNIMKSYRSRTAKGKSVQFEFIIEVAYLFGVMGKFISFANTGVLPYAVWFYFADITMVGIDIVLYFRNTKLDKIADSNLENIHAKATDETLEDESTSVEAA